MSKVDGEPLKHVEKLLSGFLTEWAELIWARLEVERVQTATQISLPSVRVVVATPSGSAFWMTLSWKLSSSLQCWCILTASVTLPDVFVCTRLGSFCLLSRWPYPVEWRLARQPRVVAATKHRWHVKSFGTSSLRSSGCSAKNLIQRISTNSTATGSYASRTFLSIWGTQEPALHVGCNNTKMAFKYVT